MQSPVSPHPHCKCERDVCIKNTTAIVDSPDWTNYHEMKRAFGSVDAVGNDRYVFNIKGNKYRLITMIFFNRRTVYIRFIGTHAEYDRIKANEA